MQKSETLKMINSFPKESMFSFYLVLIYLVLEFARPQMLIREIGQFHLPAIVTIILTISICFSGKINLSDKQTKLFILLLTLMAFHIPLALNNYWAFYTAIAMLQTFVAYLSIITFIDSFQKFNTMINMWFGIHIYLAIMGIIGKGRGVGGFLRDENDFSMTLNMMIPFSFFMGIAETGRLKKLIYWGLTALFLFTNVLTFSRGGFIGLVAVGLYCWFRSPKKVVSALLIALLVLFTVQFAPEKYWEEIKSIQKGTSDSTGEDRVYIWKIGWKMFLDNPVLGVGQRNFPFQFSNYEGQGSLHGTSRAGHAAHSIYFTLLPELGVVGTLIFLGMFYYIYKDIRFIYQLKASKLGGLPEREKLFNLSLGMEGGFIGFLFSGIFISVLYYPNFWILMGFMGALKKTIAALNYEENPASH